MAGVGRDGIELVLEALMASWRCNRLPTRRELAASAGVAMSTVNESVRALADRGIVDLRYSRWRGVRPSKSVVEGLDAG